MLDIVILIRGAGEMASGVAHRLHRSGFKLVLTDIERPMAVRRRVSFCEAIHDGVQTVEGVRACLVHGVGEIAPVWGQSQIPVLIDPEMLVPIAINPQVIIDALLAKRNTGLHRSMAPFTIGLGPGFCAPHDVHVAVETHRGHNLGRIIYEGEPEANTGIPGDIAGHSVKRVLRAPADGIFMALCSLGDSVETGQVIASVSKMNLHAEVGGVLRGLIRDQTPVIRGQKVGDIDPRGRKEYVSTISEKARAVGGAVLEAIMAEFNKNRGTHR
jgi:xanthine dehydrogenase accessory factor